MLVKTERFGDTEGSEGAMIHFPEGILGFEGHKWFSVIEGGAAAPVHFLQSVDDPSLSFAVLEPQTFRPDYAPQLWDEDRVALQWEGGQQQLQVLAILTLVPDLREATANLLAPIVINVDRRIGRQVVQGVGEYSTCHRLVDELARAQRLVANNAQILQARSTESNTPLSDFPSTFIRLALG